MEGNKVNKKKQVKKRKIEYPSNVNLFDKRVIYLHEEIDNRIAKETIFKLLQLDRVNQRDIVMYINSHGGSVKEGLAIYDVMNYIKSDIKTIAIGRVASMASILLVNGTKGKRYILPNAEIMIHEVSGGNFGKITEMQDQLNHARSLNERLYKLLASKPNISLKYIKKSTIQKDKWFSAEEALKQGFVDYIL